MPAPTRRAIIAILAKHDLSDEVALAVRNMGATVRQLTIQTPAEFGAFIDAATGVQLGDIIAGTRTRLQVGPLLRQMVPGRRYVCVHSHPEDDSLSPDDVALVLRYDAVCVISAVGRHGHWYVLSLDPDRPRPSAEQVADAFNEARTEIVVKYERLARAGQISRREARSAATHELWERVARACGLRYDRV